MFKNKILFFLPGLLFLILIGLQPAQAATTCVTQFVARNSDGQFIPDVRFEVFKHAYDADNKPRPGQALGSAVTDKVLGRANLTFTGEPSALYVLKVSVINKDFTSYYYYNQDLKCNQNSQVVKILSGINFVFRDGEGTLRKNTSFDLYTQKYDIDNSPIKEKKDLVGTFNSGETGSVMVYVPEGSARSQDGKINDDYILEVSGKNGSKFTKYDINVTDEATTQMEYVFSDLKLILKNAAGQLYPDKTRVEVYTQQQDINQEYKLNIKLGEFTINNQGYGLFEYPAGQYALVVKDDLGKNNIFWNVKFVDQKRTTKTLVANTTKINILRASGQAVGVGTDFKIYPLVERDGYYYQTETATSFKISSAGYTNLSLASQPYLVVYREAKDGGVNVDYGRAFWAVNNKLQTVTVQAVAGQEVTAGQKFSVTKPATSNDSVANRLKGYILLQVEEKGEAWYINPKDLKRYYLADGATAYQAMRKLGVGIGNEDLKKIPVGVVSQVSSLDSDNDGLPDKAEEALGTNVNQADSDSDGYNDGQEVRGGFNPLGAGKWPIDVNFSTKQLGKILLQVQSRGEAWYINPKDGKRYYMKDGQSAYEIMRFLSLGANNEDISSIDEGILN